MAGYLPFSLLFILFCILGFYLRSFSFFLKNILRIFFTVNLLIWILSIFTCLDIYLSFIFEKCFHWAYNSRLTVILFQHYALIISFYFGFSKSMEKLAICLNFVAWKVVAPSPPDALKSISFVFGFYMINRCGILSFILFRFRIN